MLWIADHKAIKHILHKSGYDYPKPPGDKPLRAMVTDEGLAWADGASLPSTRVSSYRSSTGEVHKRYKKVLLPAFGIPEAKEFLPSFTHVVTRVGDVRLHPIRLAHSLFQLADRWTNELSDKNLAGVINVADGLMRVTLDA